MSSQDSNSSDGQAPKLSAEEIIKGLNRLEYADASQAIVTGMLLFQNAPAMWSELLKDWADGIEEGDDLVECQGSMDQYNANIREHWSGESRQDPEKRRRNGHHD